MNGREGGQPGKAGVLLASRQEVQDCEKGMSGRSLGASAALIGAIVVGVAVSAWSVLGGGSQGTTRGSVVEEAGVAPSGFGESVCAGSGDLAELRKRIALLEQQVVVIGRGGDGEESASAVDVGSAPGQDGAEAGLVADGLGARPWAAEEPDPVADPTAYRLELDRRLELMGEPAAIQWIVDTYDSALESERMDADYDAEVRTAMREFERTGELGSLRLRDLRCGATICRMALEFADPDARSVFQGSFLHHAPWSEAGDKLLRSETPDDLSVEIYFARKQANLPLPQLPPQQ